MLIKVMFHSIEGTTERLAASIASAAGSRPEIITESSIVHSADLLFLGDEEADKKPTDLMIKLIEKLDVTKVKMVALFGTYSNNKDTLLTIKEALKKKGIPVLEESFSCKGKSGLFKSAAHPDDKELNSAVLFANRAIATAKGK